MQEPNECTAIRDASRAFEAALPAGQKKKLGQFFTGIPLGKLLSHLALDAKTKTVLDPMAGHGDLLDATLEAAGEQGIKLRNLDGIELDDATAVMCRQRLSDILGKSNVAQTLALTGDAFEPRSIGSLSHKKYDLVITNPPYVRYQEQRGINGKCKHVRDRLSDIVETLVSNQERDVFRHLIKNYSGLSDLSVPSWILASALVKSGGRIALVVPATWRNRDYADVIRYLLLRCFSLEYVVEDTQPGWFSDALVRTNLIIARKLSEKEIAQKLSERRAHSNAVWVQVSPRAANQDSLVGAAFPGEHPEFDFAQWLRHGLSASKDGISLRPFDLSEEWGRLQAKIGHTRWCRKLEGSQSGAVTSRSSMRFTMPEMLEGLLSNIQVAEQLTNLDRLGIRVGQGLRTGCNRFFYVTACDTSNDTVLVQASTFFAGEQFFVPASVLKPVLRRQSELEIIGGGHVPSGRVLDLREYVLPEDYEQVLGAKDAYEKAQVRIPERMPNDLATFVRRAANTIVGDPDAGNRVPDLSAVRTNVRISRDGQTPPRFWYMLPDFTPRHIPAAFVARINHGVPWVEANLSQPILIDANFSSFWSDTGEWSPFALKALLNSAWCRTYMEVIGTQLGGGALKLEATHLRQMVVPDFGRDDIEQFTRLGKNLSDHNTQTLHQIDELVIGRLIKPSGAGPTSVDLARLMTSRAHELSLARRKAA